MNEFNKIVSKTATSFKAPMFSHASRKQILEPLNAKSKFFNKQRALYFT